jgi:hypothetical protein
MDQTIKLARQALMLFIQSLSAGSKFNVCSYGSDFSFLFGGTSVNYDEKTLKEALDSISKFTADLGGTEIYQPLQSIFKMIKE